MKKQSNKLCWICWHSVGDAKKCPECGAVKLRFHTEKDDSDILYVTMWDDKKPPLTKEVGHDFDKYSLSIWGVLLENNNVLLYQMFHFEEGYYPVVVKLGVSFII